MDIIFILIGIGLALIYISFQKKDSTLLILSGIFNSINGVSLYKMAFENSHAYGLIIIFISLYIMLRTAIEMITSSDKDNIKEGKNG